MSLLLNDDSDADDGVITINQNEDNYIRCMLTDDVDDETERFKCTSHHECSPKLGDGCYSDGYMFSG